MFACVYLGPWATCLASFCFFLFYSRYEYDSPGPQDRHFSIIRFFFIKISPKLFYDGVRQMQPRLASLLVHLFSSFVLKRNESIFDGPSNYPGSSALCVLCLPLAQPWEPSLYSEVIWFMLVVLLHSVSSFNLRILDGLEYDLRSNHLLFFS